MEFITSCLLPQNVLYTEGKDWLNSKFLGKTMGNDGRRLVGIGHIRDLITLTMQIKQLQTSHLQHYFLTFVKSATCSVYSLIFTI